MTEPRRSSGVFEQASPEPLRVHLLDDLDESQVKSMWQRIDHTPPRARRPWLLACVAAAAVLLLTLGALYNWREPEIRQLALVSGATPGVLSANAGPVVT